MLVFSVKYLNSAPYQNSLCREVMLKLCFWSHTKVDLILYWILKDFWGRSDGREGSLRDEIKKFTHRTWMKAEKNVSITPTSKSVIQKSPKHLREINYPAEFELFFFPSSSTFHLICFSCLTPDIVCRVVIFIKLPSLHPTLLLRLRMLHTFCLRKQSGKYSIISGRWVTVIWRVD